MKKGSSEPPAGMSPETLARLQAVADMPDDAIDLSDPDAPEVRDWTGAVRGRFHRPAQQSTSLHVDADVLAYFQAEGPEYQARINRVLRASMLRSLRRRVKEGTSHAKRQG